MLSFSAHFFENGQSITELSLTQIPSFFTEKHINELVNKTLSNNFVYNIMINEYFLEDTIEFTTTKYNIIPEDVIMINCISSNATDNFIDLEDTVTSFFYNRNTKELIVSLLNKDINAYKDFKLISKSNKAFTIKEIINEKIFITTSDNLLINDCIVCENVLKFVGKDKYLSKDKKIYDYNKNILLCSENSIIDAKEIDNSFIYLTNKNELFRDNSCLLKLDDDEVLYCSFIAENIILCTNKYIYLINEDNQIRNIKTITFIDNCFINDSCFLIIFYNKIYVYNLKDLRIIRIIEVERQITQVQIDNDSIFVSHQKRISFFKLY
ncbi:hypothetical protein H312_03154 [Anncaliia algerae PRA339]|uniref:Uncharacterized protein n=1 Tax=Anncaliia algerae PRA339 TaxID=1288291 RepID=A0A059EX69_9MICR|nr:hypothetical protein H312_03154 [Anncaliia algerae PRA339]